jgi:mRNA interferase RelE/StbE
LTSFNLEFLPRAKKEWDKLGSSIREQFARKLRERFDSPRVPAAQLSNIPDCYKIKLGAAGYRLVYRVDDGRVMVIVVAVGKHDRNLLYKMAAGRQ